MKRNRLTSRLSALLVCLVLLAALLPTTAQASYSVYVNAKDGLGLNLRAGPGTEYATVRSSPVPMYTRLTISRTETSAAGNPWGYTSYDGVSGWVCLVETTTYDPTSVPEQELEPQPLGPTVPDVQDTQDTQENQENQEPAAPATVQADSDSAVAAPVMTMAIGILIGLLAAILVVLIVIAARKKK